MSGFFAAGFFSRYIVFYKGCVILRWELIAWLFVIRMSVFIISFVVRRARRNRLHELNLERENMQERLRLMGEQMREMDRSLGPVMTLVNQRVDSLAEEGQPGIPRLRLNADGSITEYS